MTLMEFVGCTLLAFGPPFSMFIVTIAHDPVRIIIMIAAAFFWLLSLLTSSLWWFIVVPLRGELAFGLVFSVIFQEAFRCLTYLIIRRAENGLKKITDDSTQLIENKHILSYVSGFGFGLISGMFSLVNVVADSIGPSTMGLKSGSEQFFITSSALCLCFILLHTFWSIIFFDALDTSNLMQIVYVVLTHMLASCITLFNRYEVYSATLLPIYCILVVTAMNAFKVAGGSRSSLKRVLLCA
ncbi:gamma-secretase subunit Aph-1 [Atheta coriaria]|uniref:gamma-secretase subunit Aph-1 n=1 Tax=Dalotia coriaria TaxID=877792 RepID=UPI0031F38F74